MFSLLCALSLFFAITQDDAMPMPTVPKTVAVVANGAIHDFSIISSILKTYPYVIAADGGLRHCDAMGICPDLIIGDLDSVPPDLLAKYAHVEVKRFPSDKDESDLELAIQSIIDMDKSLQVEKITIFGALEKRTDHALGNLHLIRRYPGRVFIESEQELLFSVEGTVKIPCFPGQTISFIPIGSPAKGVTSQGLKWELNNATFDKNFFSLSNICLTNPIRITIAEGDLLCCLQKNII